MLQGHKNSVISVSHSPIANIVATGSGDNKVPVVCPSACFVALLSLHTHSFTTRHTARRAHGTGHRWDARELGMQHLFGTMQARLWKYETPSRVGLNN
jgi:hypothetical protein